MNGQMGAEAIVGPDERFHGTVLIVAPHMDDEVLACGGLIALLPDKERIFVVYATDGMKSPAPVVPWRDSITPDLGALRMKESVRAVGLLGVPSANTHFLGLPEARLRQHLEDLKLRLMEHVTGVAPDHILIPFRYDRHPDHLAINRVITEARRTGRTTASLVEYFVYYRWRLLPERDVRRYIRGRHLFAIDIDAVAGIKRTALNCFTTQTTCFYPWQTRPILTPMLLDEECQGPEWFLEYDSAHEGASVFSHSVFWIRVAHRVEPVLQRWKYLMKSYLKRSFCPESDDG